VADHQGREYQGRVTPQRLIKVMYFACDHLAQGPNVR